MATNGRSRLGDGQGEAAKLIADLRLTPTPSPTRCSSGKSIARAKPLCWWRALTGKDSCMRCWTWRTSGLGEVCRTAFQRGSRCAGKAVPPEQALSCTNRAYWESRFYDEAYWAKYPMCSRRIASTHLSSFRLRERRLPCACYISSTWRILRRGMGITRTTATRPGRAEPSVRWRTTAGRNSRGHLGPHLSRWGSGGGIPGSRRCKNRPGLVWATGENLCHTKAALAMRAPRARSRCHPVSNA